MENVIRLKFVEKKSSYAEIWHFYIGETKIMTFIHCEAKVITKYSELTYELYVLLPASYHMLSFLVGILRVVSRVALGGGVIILV
jgi:hypothetical protein